MTAANRYCREHDDDAIYVVCIIGWAGTQYIIVVMVKVSNRKVGSFLGAIFVYVGISTTTS